MLRQPTRKQAILRPVWGANGRVESSLEAVRATQLYRTLLHEIGHHVDRLEYAAGADAAADEQFFARPHIERETAAHQYADTWAANLRANRTIPFTSILKQDLRTEGIDPLVRSRFRMSWQRGLELIVATPTNSR